MRIIAGKWRGRRMIAPPGKQTRPILDRVKTVLFDMLGHRLEVPGQLPPLAVLDLFAGSGALGLEALSRGARFCLFVEKNRRTAAVLRQNMDSLGITDEGMVIKDEATAGDLPPPPGLAGVAGQYELVFVDPPYRMLAGPQPDPSVKYLFQRLNNMPIISSDSLVVVRHPRFNQGEPDLSPLVEIDRRDVGTMTLRFAAIHAADRASINQEPQ